MLLMSWDVMVEGRAGVRACESGRRQVRRFMQGDVVLGWVDALDTRGGL
jgi:hypothetical protein